MSENLMWQGLTLSAVGMGLTFAALGILILAMIVLDRLFRSRPSLPRQQAPAGTPAAHTLARDSEEDEIVAAIAIALAHFRSLDICRSGLGTALEAGQGPWWNSGLSRQLAIKALPGQHPPPPSPANEYEGVSASQGDTANR